MLPRAFLQGVLLAELDFSNFLKDSWLPCCRLIVREDSNPPPVMLTPKAPTGRLVN
jgi:hypothetical protein